MGAMQEVRVPDIGDFKDVEVIEILVKPGDTVAAERREPLHEHHALAEVRRAEGCGVAPRPGPEHRDLGLDGLRAARSDRCGDGRRRLSRRWRCCSELDRRQPRALRHLVADLDQHLLHGAAVRRRDLHRRLVALEGEERLFLDDGIAGRDEDFDHVDLLEVADVGKLDGDGVGHASS
jgi:hypothetical protein